MMRPGLQIPRRIPLNLPTAAAVAAALLLEAMIKGLTYGEQDLQPVGVTGFNMAGWTYTATACAIGGQYQLGTFSAGCNRCFIHSGYWPAPTTASLNVTWVYRNYGLDTALHQWQSEYGKWTRLAPGVLPEVSSMIWTNVSPLPDPNLAPNPRQFRARTQARPMTRIVGVEAPLVGPVPEPVLAPELGRPPFHRPPGPGVREPKFKWGFVGGNTVAGIILNVVSESHDFTKSLYKALPKWYQTCKGDAVCELKQIYNHFDEMNIPAAIANVVNNQIGDFIAGKMGQAWAGAYQKAFNRNGQIAGDILKMTNRTSNEAIYKVLKPILDAAGVDVPKTGFTWRDISNGLS
jgi:hypothetical protein